MPGIRIEGQARPAQTGTSNPAQGVAADPFGGLSLSQLNGLFTGSVGMSDSVRTQLQMAAQRNMDTTGAAVRPGSFGPAPAFIPPGGGGPPSWLPPGTTPYSAWNPASRGAFPNARATDSNYNYIMSGARLNASAENRNNDAVYSTSRRMAEWENNNRNYTLAGARADATAENSNRDAIYRNVRAAASAENSDRNYAMSGARANATAENNNRDAIYRNVRAAAAYENADRDRVTTQIRREADYENQDRKLAEARKHRMDYEIRQEAEYENRDRDLAQAKGRRAFDEVRAAANYENRDSDLRWKNMRAQADVENAAFDRSPEGREFRRAHGGGGNMPPGGGGGGSPWWYGGGGAGGFIKRAAGAGAERMGMGTAFMGATVALEVIKDLVTVPQQIASLARQAVGASTPWWNYQSTMYGQARAGGFNGSELSSSFYNGLEPPSWMRKLGLGPQEASGLLQGYGIVQSGQYGGLNSMGIVKSLAEMPYIPALSGLPAGALESSVSNAAAYGAYTTSQAGVRLRGNTLMASPSAGDPVQQYSAQMVEVFAKATELGLNRAAILRSIDSGIMQTASAGGGLGVTPGSAGNFMLGFAGMPGGNTGAAGLSAMQSGVDFVGRSGKEALPTLALQSVFGRMSSVSDVRSYVESKSPGSWDSAVRRNPAIQQVLEKSLGRKDLIGLNLFRDVMKNFPDVAFGISTDEGPGANMFAPGTAGSLATRSAQSGVDAVTLQTHDNNIAAGVGKGLPSDRIAMLRSYYKSKGYTDANISGIIAYGLEETGGSLDPRAFNSKGGGRGAMGTGQWRGARIAAFENIYHHSPIDPNISPNQLLMEQAEFTHRELQGSEKAAGSALKDESTSQGSASVMVRLFGRPGADSFNADRKARQYAGQMDTTPDTNGLEEQNAARSLGMAGSMMGSRVTAAEVQKLVLAMDMAVQKIEDAARAAHDILTNPSTTQPAYLGVQ